MTVEQYRQLPDREDVIQELHWGMVVTLTRPKMRHAKPQDVSVGRGLVPRTLRDAADREVDRARAHARGIAIAQLMRGVDFEKASKTLVPYCLALMQNVSDGERKDLMDAVETLAGGPMVLTAAVEALCDELKPGSSTDR